jgi:phage regulator Rha-like protein
MSKVVSVLGEEGALKFKASYLTPQNKEVAMYSFPKREATLMAMSFNACRTLKCVRLKQGVALIKRDL